jgi:hypothetical protein
MDAIPYFDDNGIGYVERMAQSMAPYYEFYNAGGQNVTLGDYTRAADPLNPTTPERGGAYEMLVEPYLEAATGNKINLATLFFGFTDAARNPPEGGWYQSGPTNLFAFIALYNALITRLLADGVERILTISPIYWIPEIPGSFPTTLPWLPSYPVGMNTLDKAGFWPLSVSHLDIYRLLGYPASFPPNRWWPKQGAHDRLAVVIGRHIRQGTHYKFAWPGIGRAPFHEHMDWQEEPEPWP